MTLSPNRIRLQTRISYQLPPKFFQTESLATAINLLVYGIVLKKHYKSAKLFHNCVFYILEEDSSYLQWLSHSKPYNKTRIDLKSIKNITDDPKFDNKLAQKFGKGYKDASQLLFILHGNLHEKKVLILKFKDEKKKHLFWQGMQHFSNVIVEKEATFSDFRRTLAKKLFVNGDKDGSKSLDLQGVKKVLQKLHLEISSELLMKMFEKYDKDQNNCIDWNEFQAIIQDMTVKNELEPVFRKYCKNAKGVNRDQLEDVRMSYEDFQEFLIKEQKQEMTPFEFRKIMKLFAKENSNNFFKEESKNHFSMIEPDISEISLSFSEFCTIIFSKNNEAFDPENQEIYQEMDKPLTDYYICSSHNTYLMSNQLTGKSSTKAYIEAFERGCRCVELDCWEGDKEPIIYHGYTFTSKILFRDVIQTIKDYAFVSNPYPVILSFENHCSKQQDVMADILDEVLGEMLYVLPENYIDLSKLPSPDQLKYKVLVKDKGVLPIVFNEQFFSGFKVDWSALDKNNLLECDDEEEYLPSKNNNLQNFKLSQDIQKKFICKEPPPIHIGRENSINMNNSLERNSTLNREISTSLNNFETSQPYIPSKFKSMHINTKKEIQEDDSISSANNIHTLTSHTKKPNSQTLDSSSLKHIIRSDVAKHTTILQNCVDSGKQRKKTVASLKLKKLLALYGIKMNLLIPRMSWNVSSINEKKFEKLCKAKEEKLQDFMRNYFLRIYPAGTRVDSSNYDPVKGFNFGAQMTALNMQTSDLPLLLYTTRFKENGGRSCGYVLKPDHLRNESFRHLSDFTKIRKIVSLEVISGQQIRHDSEKDIVSPFVEVSFRGIDQDEEENPEVFRSKTILNNGFNPEFHLQSDFRIYCPDSAFLIFKVFTEKIAGGEKISWNALPINCMRPGYRILPLLNSKLNPIEFSCLLLRVQILDDGP